MNRIGIKRLAAAGTLALALTAGFAPTAMAKHGADDAPRTTVATRTSVPSSVPTSSIVDSRRGRGADDSTTSTTVASRRRGRGSDDPAGHARRGADDAAGHTRKGRGSDDPAGHARRGADDPAGHVRGEGPGHA